MSFISDNFVRPKVALDNRIAFIDLAKGMCIILVILTHVVTETFHIPGLIHLRMPLYFVLSGLFFKSYDGFSIFVKRKINKLIIPFLFFYVLGYVAFRFGKTMRPDLGNYGGITEIFYSHRYFNNPIWFLLCLFWDNVYFWIISAFIPREWFRALIVLLCGAIGYAIGEAHYIYTVSALTSLPFFYFGYLLRKTSILRGPGSVKTLIWGGVSLCVSVCLAILLGLEGVEFYCNVFHDNLIISFIISIGCVVGTLLICKNIGWIPIVSYCGRYSIIILCIHYPIKTMLRPLLEYGMSSVFADILLFILTFVFCWLCIPVCRRFLGYFTAQKDLIPVKNDMVCRQNSRKI